MNCYICGNKKRNTSYSVREMMFGFRNEFSYFQCQNCNCLQIKSIPDDVSKYYPENYYSFNTPKDFERGGRVSKWLKAKRLNYFLTGSGCIGNIASKIWGGGDLEYWMKTPYLNSSSSILDIGCGGGERLFKLSAKGFVNITGVDPFIKEDKIYNCGVRLQKREVYDVSDKYDFIMLHHSFEHMSEPYKVLEKILEILKDKGTLLIRIPIIGYAWEKYGVNWVQLDAPRHFFLHSLKSINLIAKKSGFKVCEVIFDSEEFQILASEQYSNDIPLFNENSYLLNSSLSMFTDSEKDAAIALAKDLNETKRGDQACFFLKKI